MLVNNRVILKKGGVTTDYSIEASDAIGGVIPFNLAPGDELFIGSFLPFNHRYFKVITPNTNASKIQMSYWTQAQWTDSVDMFDLTYSGGATLSKSGILAWQPDIQGFQWGFTWQTSAIPDLAQFKIYNLWWARLTVTAQLSAGTQIGLIGHKFSEDSDLFSEYPEFSNAAFYRVFSDESGKSDWSRQAFLAAEYIIQDLRDRGVVVSPGQILDWRIFKHASVHKIAEIIFRAMGDDYKDKLQRTIEAYRLAKDIKVFDVDQNMTARPEPIEQTRFGEFVTR